MNTILLIYEKFRVCLYFTTSSNSFQKESYECSSCAKLHKNSCTAQFKKNSHHGGNCRPAFRLSPISNPSTYVDYTTTNRQSHRRTNNFGGKYLVLVGIPKLMSENEFTTQLRKCLATLNGLKVLEIYFLLQCVIKFLKVFLLTR